MTTAPISLRSRPATPTAPSRISPFRAATAVWTRHKDLLRNAATLLATTGVTSVLGFSFWAFAAREFSQQAVGYGSAAISAMTLLGTIGVFGLGTVLIGELPRRSPRAGLVSAVLLACGIGSLLLGLAFAVGAPLASKRFGDLVGQPAQALTFAVGVALTAVTSVFDQATIGLLRGGVQLARNMVFAITKMAVLPATAIVLHDQFGAGITMSWIAGIAVSMAASAIWLRVRGCPVLPRPDWAVLRALGKTTLAHNWLNLAIAVPVTLIPVLVTVVEIPAPWTRVMSVPPLPSFEKRKYSPLKLPVKCRVPSPAVVSLSVLGLKSPATWVGVRLVTSIVSLVVKVLTASPPLGAAPVPTSTVQAAPEAKASVEKLVNCVPRVIGVPPD